MSATTVAGLLLIGLPLAFNAAFARLIGVIGLVIGPLLMVCSLDFVGGHEPTSWKLAERLTPATYIAWSLWLVATGVALLA